MTTENWLGVGVFSALHLADCAQTYSAAHDNRFEEGNPFLGKNPTDTRVGTWCATSLITHIAGVNLLPSKLRPWVQGVSIGMKATTVLYNYTVGVRIKF